MRIVAVTGSERGIGRNIARAFESLGDCVVGIDKNAAEFNTDLAAPNAARILIDAIKAKHGRLDVLINNARSSCRSLLGEETEADWDHEMSVNLKAAYFLGKYTLEIMPSGGAIINVGSITANFVSHESAAYQISKGACLQMTRALAMMGAAKGIRANCILPGCIIQDEHRERYGRADNVHYRDVMNKIHPIGGPGRSDEVSSIAVFLASEAASFITGTSIVADGGMTIQDMAAFHYKDMRGL